MAEEKRQSFLKGAAILSISTIIVKAVGLLFSIPLSNRLDSAAMGYFNTAYSVFAVFNALATAGLPVAVSKMISSAYAVGKKKQADRIFTVAFAAFFILGLVFSSAMFVFSDQIANMMNFPGASFSIKALAPTVFFVCIMSAVRGYFQGRSHMVPTAISQIIESVMKVVIGISLAFYVEEMYHDSSLSSAAAIIGVSASAGLGALYLTIYKQYKKKRDIASYDEQEQLPARSSIAKSLFSLAIPIAIGSCLLYFLDVIDVGIIGGQLQLYPGINSETASSIYANWGTGTLKIFDLPGAFAIALSTSILPVISNAFTRKDNHTMARMTSAGLRITFLVTIPSAVGFIIFAEPLGQLFYFANPEMANGVKTLLPVAATGVIFNGVLYVSNSILQALGKVNLPVISMTIGGILRIILNYILVAIPEINITGAAISTVVSTMFMMALNFIFLYRFIPQAERPFKMLLPIILSALLMGGASYLVYIGLSQIISVKISVVISIIFAVAIYVVFALITKAVKPQDIRMLPKGDKIVKLLRLDKTRHIPKH